MHNKNKPHLPYEQIEIKPLMTQLVSLSRTIIIIQHFVTQLGVINYLNCLTSQKYLNNQAFLFSTQITTYKQS